MNLNTSKNGWSLGYACDKTYQQRPSMLVDQKCTIQTNCRGNEQPGKANIKKKTWIQENDKRTKSIERQQHQKRNKRKEKLEEQHFKTEKNTTMSPSSL